MDVCEQVLKLSRNDFKRLRSILTKKGICIEVNEYERSYDVKINISDDNIKARGVCSHFFYNWGFRKAENGCVTINLPASFNIKTVNDVADTFIASVKLFYADIGVVLYGDK